MSSLLLLIRGFLKRVATSPPATRFLAIVLLSSPALTVSQERTEEAVAPKLEAAAKKLDAELEATLAELNELRNRIAEEKPPLATKMQETAMVLRQKQREYDIARSSREAISHDFEKAEQDLQRWRDERIYLDGLLFDFRKNYEASSSLATVESLKDLLLASETPDDSGTAARIDLVAEAIADLKATVSAESVSGEAIAPDGTMRKGRFVEAGPVSWFLDESGEISGLISAASSLTPEVVPGTTDRNEIEALLNGKEASPTFDPTLGTAVALNQVEDTFLEHILKGGIWIYPILFLALVALSAAVLKGIQLSRYRDPDAEKISSIITLARDRHAQEALSETAMVRHPSARILHRGIQMLGNEFNESTPTRDDLEEAMYERFLEEQPKLQRWLPFIAIAAATAPLLGLLGTVTGMIHTFQQITVFGTGDAKPLAGGISEALVTTEFGLVVAIPSLIAHALLSRRAAGVRANMEITSLAFLNGVRPLEAK